MEIKMQPEDSELSPDTSNFVFVFSAVFLACARFESYNLITDKKAMLQRKCKREYKCM